MLGSKENDTSSHPRTDGTSKILNHMLENYLLNLCPYRRNNWDEFFLHLFKYATGNL